MRLQLRTDEPPSRRYYSPDAVCYAEELLPQHAACCYDDRGHDVKRGVVHDFYDIALRWLHYSAAIMACIIMMGAS